MMVAMTRAVNDERSEMNVRTIMRQAFLIYRKYKARDEPDPVVISVTGFGCCVVGHEDEVPEKLAARQNGARGLLLRVPTAQRYLQDPLPAPGRKRKQEEVAAAAAGAAAIEANGNAVTAAATAIEAELVAAAAEAAVAPGAEPNVKIFALCPGQATGRLMSMKTALLKIPGRFL